MDLEDIISNIDLICVDDDHPFDWRVNEKGEPFTIVLVSDREPGRIEPTDGIKIKTWKGNNGKWYLMFVREDQSYNRMFQAFCRDIVESSRDLDPATDVQFAMDRYMHWKKMFKPHRDLLPESAIEGLIGEMCVLKDIMFDRYGSGSSVESWMNSHRGKQDFIQKDRWYEIKTVLEGRSVIRVSSLDQLDRDDNGRLIVVRMRRSNKVSPKSITLNSIVAQISDSIADPDAKTFFDDTLLYAGYQEDPAYDDTCFELIRYQEFEVRDGFPRLRGSELMKTGIVKGSYDIELSAISEFEVTHGSERIQKGADERYQHRVSCEF